MEKSVKNILIYRLGSLGDTVMVLPCFHKVRESFPGADITLLTNRPVAAKAAPIEAILGNEYFYNRVIDYPVGTRNPFILAKLALQIRALNIDTVVNLTAARSASSAKRDRWFFKASGVKRLLGFPEAPEDFKVSVDPKTGDREWEAKRLARRIKVLGRIDFEDDRYWDLRLTREELKVTQQIFSQLSPIAPIIAISAGTKMQSKDWGADNWLSLIRKLRLTLPGWQLVLIGAADEAALGDQCLEAWGGIGLNLCGQTSPRVSAAILQKAKVFVGHDSGPMHLAGCVGTPAVAVFSARNLPRQWYPRGHDNHILYHRTDCAGCGLEECIEQKKKCILSITVDEVQSAILKTVGVVKV